MKSTAVSKYMLHLGLLMYDSPFVIRSVAMLGQLVTAHAHSQFLILNVVDRNLDPDRQHVSMANICNKSDRLSFKAFQIFRLQSRCCCFTYKIERNTRHEISLFLNFKAFQILKQCLTLAFHLQNSTDCKGQILHLSHLQIIPNLHNVVFALLFGTQNNRSRK